MILLQWVRCEIELTKSTETVAQRVGSLRALRYAADGKNNARDETFIYLPQETNQRMDSLRP